MTVIINCNNINSTIINNLKNENHKKIYLQLNTKEMS